MISVIIILNAGAIFQINVIKFGSLWSSRGFAVIISYMMSFIFQKLTAAEQ